MVEHKGGEIGSERGLVCVCVCLYKGGWGSKSRISMLQLQLKGGCGVEGKEWRERSGRVGWGISIRE